MHLSWGSRPRLYADACFAGLLMHWLTPQVNRPRHVTFFKHPALLAVSGVAAKMIGLK